MKMSQRVILCDILYSFFNYLKILYSNFAYFATPMTILLFIPFKFALNRLVIAVPYSVNL